MEHDALNVALALLRDPSLARTLEGAPLPAGISVVLAIAVGDEAALKAAEGRTGYSTAKLREASGFFIEQALLGHRADSYRMLGGSRSSTHEELRRNMALLIRWLHPDLNSSGVAIKNREVFTSRVTRAWQDLKTEEHRRNYDLKSAAVDEKAEPNSSRRSAASAPRTSAQHIRQKPRMAGEQSSKGRRTTAVARVAPKRNGRFSPLSLRRMDGESFWLRIWNLLWR